MFRSISTKKLKAMLPEILKVCLLIFLPLPPRLCYLFTFAVLFVSFSVCKHHHHHHGLVARAPDWSVAVSTSCFQRPLPCWVQAMIERLKVCFQSLKPGVTQTSWVTRELTGHTSRPSVPHVCKNDYQNSCRQIFIKFSEGLSLGTRIDWLKFGSKWSGFFLYHFFVIGEMVILFCCSVDYSRKGQEIWFSPT